MSETSKTEQYSSAAAYDEKKKLSELQSMILNKGDLERERILSGARDEAVRWTGEQSKQLEAMIELIKADAAKRSSEMTSRQLAEAEILRDKSRLRLQNELVNKALVLLQNALVDFSGRSDYDVILTGVAAEACERLPKGQRLKMRLRAEDGPYGEAIANALSRRFPDLDISFDAAPAQITGGVYLYSEEEKWQIVADWKSKAEEMAGSVAKALLAEL